MFKTVADPFHLIDLTCDLAEVCVNVKSKRFDPFDRSKTMT